MARGIFPAIYPAVMSPTAFGKHALAGSGGVPIATFPITAWGDSLTLGTGGSGTKLYPRAAAIRLNTTSFPTSRGVGGQTSTQIAARQGGVPIAVTVSGNSIPASGGVAVTAKSVNVLYSAGAFTGTITGSIAGIPGTMSTDASGNWTFNRTSSGSATAAAPGTQFIPADAVAERTNTQWLMAGTNNADQTSTVLADIAAMVAYLGHSRYRVLSVLPSTAHGQSVLNSIAAINASLASTYGSRFVNVLAALQAANDGSANDLADVAAGLTPRSLRSDAVHLNSAGYEIVGFAVAGSYPAADQVITPDLGLAAGWGEFDISTGWTIGGGWSFSSGRLLRDGSAASEIIRTVPAMEVGQTYRVTVRGYFTSVNIRNGGQFLGPTGMVRDFVAANTSFGFQGGSTLELLSISLAKIS